MTSPFSLENAPSLKLTNTLSVALMKLRAFKLLAPLNASLSISSRCESAVIVRLVTYALSNAPVAMTLTRSGSSTTASLPRFAMRMPLMTTKPSWTNVFASPVSAVVWFSLIHLVLANASVPIDSIWLASPKVMFSMRCPVENALGAMTLTPAGISALLPVPT